MTMLRFGFAEIEAEIMDRNEGRNMINFRHPINGSWYESTDIILGDMKKYYEEKKVEMEKLVQKINSDKELEGIVIKGLKVKQYDSISR